MELYIASDLVFKINKKGVIYDVKKADSLITKETLNGMIAKHFIIDNMEADMAESCIEFTRTTGIRSTFQAICINLLTNSRTTRRTITAIKDPTDEITIYSHKLKKND